MDKNLPTLLCVDDENSVLDALNRVLRKDFNIITASSAEEALEVLHGNTEVTIVLSDFRMPGLNGVEFLKQVKRLAPNTVRAILSGQMDSKQISDAINNAEIHRFILKPWDNEYLRIQMLESLQTFQRFQEKERLFKLSITDPITGLTNHRYFQERLATELNSTATQSKSLSLLMIDVDHFKSFNDRYGHPEGDRLLASVADRIQAPLGKNSVACRYGGEEFAVILPNTNSDEAFNIAEEIRSSLESQAFIGPNARSVYITVSIGISNYPDISTNKEELVKDADIALYESKRKGRNKSTVITKEVKHA